jgi:flagellar motility protein MotE (MotC chaperone)
MRLRILSDRLAFLRLRWRLRLPRIEAVLFCVLAAKLALSGLWLLAGVEVPGGETFPAFAADQRKSQAASAQALERSWAELKTREEQVKSRESELEALRMDIEARLARLSAIQQEMKGLRDKQVKQLVEVYSNMKAEKAARLIDQLDDQVAVSIISQMPSQTAGKVLGLVQPEKAARISQRLAGAR